MWQLGFYFINRGVLQRIKACNIIFIYYLLYIETTFGTDHGLLNDLVLACIGDEPGLLRTGQSSQESGNLTLYLEVIIPDNYAAAL